MQRSLALSLFLLLAAALTAFWWLSGSGSPPPMPGPVAERPAEAAVEAAASTGAVQDQTSGAFDRQVVAARPAALLEDPEIRKGLTGFRGRVVDHEKTPVADCGVRIYRGAMDSVLPEGLDMFAEEATYVPEYVAGETRTATDGKFLIEGVWPGGFYIMFAGIGTDAPMHQLITRMPSPGEIVDLGDVMLPHAGVITGIVLDENGDPMPGALVRAADLPGALAAFFPVERFDPEGALLIRETQSTISVMEMPKWVKPAFDHLPIPTALTDSDGAFRLVGVVPGSNMLASTQRGYLSDVKASVMVRAGQTKDVGRIKLKRGEELTGRVVDTAGKPVAEADIIAGSTLSMAEVDLGQRLGHTDAEGRFSGQGFSPGKVTVAARRGKGHAWVMAQPQPIIGDVVVTLPATFAVAVSVTLTDGKPAASPRFRLLQGKAGDGAAEMHLMGFAPPLNLADRLQSVEEGRWRIENLHAGTYTLIADAPGHATGFAAFTITDADATVALELPQPRLFTVRVLGADETPIRNATIFAESRGKRLVEMPIRCGRTDPDGVLVIDKLQAESLRVSAEHPRWGVVHGEVKPGEELVLRMQLPGALHGVVTENGKPPEPAKFTVAVVRQRGNDARGPIEKLPGLVTPGLDGTFHVAALQPGSYEVTVLDSLGAMRSPGGVFSTMQDMFIKGGDYQEVQVEVVSGQTAEVTLEAGVSPIDGPTATLSGSVTIDGRLGVGRMISGQSERRRLAAKVDERGRFDFGVVPAGNVWLRVHAEPEGGVFMGPGANIWATNVELKEAEARELTIEISTSSLAGACYRPDGSPAAGVYVQARGKLKSQGQHEADVWLGGPTDAQGAFKFTQVAEGTWSLEVSTGGDDAARGRLEGIVVQGGLPVDSLRVDLRIAMIVKGRVDMAAFGTEKPRWAWIGFYRLKDDTPAGATGDWADGVGIDGDGAFRTTDLTPGRYRIRIHAQLGGDDEQSAQYEAQDIEVPPNGLADVVVQPGKRVANDN